MHPYRRQQEEAGGPKQPGIGGIVEEGGVVIDLVFAVRPRGQIDLQVTQQMRDHISEEDDAREGHDRLLAYGRLIKVDDPLYGINRNCAHAEVLCLAQDAPRRNRKPELWSSNSIIRSVR